MLKPAGNRLKPKRMVERHTQKLFCGAVNVRTLHTRVENKGGELHIGGADPTKPYDICSKLKKHHIGLCALSEVRWRGTGTFRAGEHLYLFSGVPIDMVRPVGGVAFVLDTDMQVAWRAAGSVVRYHSPRLISIKLHLGQRTFVVVSVYAPTFRATDEEKEEFYHDLRAVVRSCNAREECILMGDFNARVGTRVRPAENEGALDVAEGDDRVLGDFGLPELNDNGRLLLDFCRSTTKQPLRILSTFYQHNTYGTWQHARTKVFHQIDHVVCSSKTAALINDVKVMPGIDFDSDHRLVRVSVRVVRPCKQFWGRHKPAQDSAEFRLPRLDVSGRKNPDKIGALNGQFADLLSEGMVDTFDIWSYGLRRVGEKVLGVEAQNHRPAWQVDNAEELGALAEEKRKAFDNRNNDAVASAH